MLNKYMWAYWVFVVVTSSCECTASTDPLYSISYAYSWVFRLRLMSCHSRSTNTQSISIIENIDNDTY